LYEHLFFLVIGAIVGYICGFLIQSVKISRLNREVQELKDEYDKVMQMVISR